MPGDAAIAILEDVRMDVKAYDKFKEKAKTSAHWADVQRRHLFSYTACQQALAVLADAEFNLTKTIPFPDMEHKCQVFTDCRACREKITEI